ncbi:hypothetical protein OAJ77_01755 [Rhodospirillales bacterium]|nr:hypothetical protein [Rhodospirillales bacterium]
MKIILEDIEIAYARICGHPPLEKVKERFRAEIEEIYRTHCATDADEEIE